MKPRQLVRACGTRMLWLDRMLWALVALLASAALGYGLRSGLDGLAGMALSALAAVGWAAKVLFGVTTLTRAQAVRAAIARASCAHERSP
jgi:hypothetical protein